MFSEPNDYLAFIYAVIFLAAFLQFWHRRRFFKLSRQFPGPMEFPFLGVLPRVANPKEILPKMKMAMEVYESKTMFAYFGPQPVLYTIDPALLEKVFSSTVLVNKADILYAPLSNLFGDGLFSSKAPKWNQHRRFINPSFRVPVLRTFLPIFNRNANEFKKKLDAMVGQGGQNFPDILQRLTLTAAVETILGKQMKEGSAVDDKLVHHYTSVMKSTFMMILLNAVKLSGLAKLFNFYGSRKAVFDFVDDILMQKMAKSSGPVSEIPEKPIGDDEDLYFTTRKSIFIDEALKIYQRGQFDWKDITDESNSIIFAAFETTANIMFGSLCFLAMHPEIQEKLYEEIVSVFPDKDFNVEFEDLESCVYLDMVINETLRLAPSVPNIARGVHEDTALTEELLLPKGLLVLINIFQLHRDPSIWGPDAEKFNPDHFLPENVAERHPFSFMPFSKGVRNCIGGRYAIMAIKVVLLHTLRNYRFSTKFKFEDIEFINYITIKYVKVPLLEVHRRD